MNQVNEPNHGRSSGRSGSSSAAVIALAVVAVLSLAFAGYTALNPHAVTVTQQQILTNTQSIFYKQVQTSTIGITTTNVTTVTSIPASGYGNGNYQSCGSYGCYPSQGYSPGYYYGYNGYYSSCQYTGSTGPVTCYGYLYQAGNGCTLLVVPTTSNPYPSYATGWVNEYITLHNLPSTAPTLGSWVSVSGQLYQGYNTASNGASCPNNYLIVSTIS